MMKLITISGLDGSGKTTQLNLLEKDLKKNFKLIRFHMIDFSIANKILKRKQGTGKSQPKAKTRANKFAIFLRKIAIVIDMLRFRFYFLMKSRENKTDYLLIDRYFFDQIINIKYLDEKRKWKKKSFWQKIVEGLMVQPYLKIYLKTDPKKIINRKKKVEQGLEYLETKNDIYDLLSRRWKLIGIDGNKDIRTIQNKIKQML